MSSETLRLAAELIARPSVTPADGGCQDLLIDRLSARDFLAERMPFGEVSNFWARRGKESPLVVLVGHTDVVPTGPLDRWTSHPFQPDIRDGCLYGRGAADMKGGLAAMLTACERFVARHPSHKGSIGFLVTSDEEGPAVDGTVRVIETLSARGEKIDFCLIGEPSSNSLLGDTVKIGRRGSLTGNLKVMGKQGHIAYPQLADNPLHSFAPVMARLCAEEWDRGNAQFPPTSFQVSNLNAGTGADNVIPGELDVLFNFRFSTELDPDTIKMRFARIVGQGDFSYELAWRLGGQPFLSTPGALAGAVREAIRQVTGIETTFSTSGGTSDGRFIAPTGAEVLEFGTINSTSHQIDEHVAVEDLDRLSEVYFRTLELLLAAK